jgi:uncharacterized LabA/DUF88 family protein
LSEERLKIAVFIDFDNIEIGVKTTLGGHFDVGAVLEAIKERGEVVTKVAYGDWTRAGDYGRSLSQHAIHMVQRNLTPGGDKNGADINLALDALEMAFTHNHINAFVIVGGDSDFISLVEKLKQYDRKVFVVGGRAFTSVVMQKNCTEFIAYENVTGAAPRRPQVPAAATLAGAAARQARAEAARRSRGRAAARPAQEHAAAARLGLLGAGVRRQHVPRLRAEARQGGARDAQGLPANCARDASPNPFHVDGIGGAPHRGRLARLSMLTRGRGQRLAPTHPPQRPPSSGPSPPQRARGRPSCRSRSTSRLVTTPRRR